MDTPGNILKSERTKQNKSLSGIARSLKISVEYLEAIEEDKYSLLPAEVYTKAYLRLYAESLGLESNYVLSLYNVEPEIKPVEEPKTVQKKTPFNYKPLVITVSVLLLIIAIVILSSHRDQEPVMEIADDPKETEVLSEEKDEKLSLKITATELTWISVSIDGAKRKEWLMSSGEVITVTASDKFVIKIGNAGGTRLFLNNEDIGTLGPRGKIVDIVLP